MFTVDNLSNRKRKTFIVYMSSYLLLHVLQQVNPTVEIFWVVLASFKKFLKLGRQLWFGRNGYFFILSGRFFQLHPIPSHMRHVSRIYKVKKDITLAVTNHKKKTETVIPNILK